MSDSVTRVILNTRLDPGVQLNDTYEIDERIASGGMGEVYRGHNIQTGDPVAIKAILPELADQEAIFALFKKEATVLGRLHHDTIVRYYSFSRDPRLGRPYLAMEFVNGVSLADRMATAPLTPDEVRKLFTSVADGLAIAHGAGVIHRDLSPDNIILRDGNVAPAQDHRFRHRAFRQCRRGDTDRRRLRRQVQFRLARAARHPQP